MGLSHYIENFLRTNGFQSIVTISDLNKVFNTDTYDVNDKDLYKIFFVLLYEEFSSNDPQISFKIKETLFKFIHQIEDNLNNNTPVVEEFKDEEKTSNKDEEKASNEDKLASDWKADLDNEIFPVFVLDLLANLIFDVEQIGPVNIRHIDGQNTDPCNGQKQKKQQRDLLL